MIFHRALDFWNPMNRNIIIDILKKEKPDIIHTNMAAPSKIHRSVQNRPLRPKTKS